MICLRKRSAERKDGIGEQSCRIFKKLTRMLRVAAVLEEHRVGGPAHRLARVIPEINQQAVSVTAVIPKRGSERLQALLEDAQVPVTLVPLSVLSAKLTLLLRYVFLFPYEMVCLVHYFRSLKFDLIHVAGGAWMFKSVWAGRLAGSRVVLHLNDTYMPRPVLWMLRRSRNAVSAVIYASEASRTYYEPHIKDIPCDVIPSCLSEQFFSPYLSLPAQYENGPVVLGSVGNVSVVKGHDRLVEAAAIAARGGIKITVKIAGETGGTYADYANSLMRYAESLDVADQIDWVGPVSDVCNFLDSLDYYVCCSRAESSPMAVWEAMSRGMSVVTFDVGDAADHVRLSDAGVVVYEQSGAALADGIRLLLETRSRQRNDCIAAYARRRFSAKVVADQTAQFYSLAHHV